MNSLADLRYTKFEIHSSSAFRVMFTKMIYKPSMKVKLQ